MLYEKLLLAGGGMLEIELRADMTYLLRYGDLVGYTNHRRRLRGRTLPYEFRSVEKLRYDFEQDLAQAA